jgi:hypothetical protein
LRYQWNPKRSEFDLFALIHDRPIGDWLMDKDACKALWRALNASCVERDRLRARPKSQIATGKQLSAQAPSRARRMKSNQYQQLLQPEFNSQSRMLYGTSST